jgi:signal transduction histidine kinase
MRLSLTQKGLILVAIPLVFELGCVTLLVAAEQQAEQEAQIANRARLVSDQVNRLNRDLFSCFQLVRSASEMTVVQLVAMQKEFKDLISKLQSEYSELERLTADNPSQLAMVRRSSAGLDEAASIVENFEKRLRKGGADYTSLTRSDSGLRLASLAQRLFSQDLKLFAEEERKIAEAAPDRLAGYRHQILVIAFTAVLVGIIFSVVVAVFLVRDITGRLKILSVNAKRISQGKTLLPRVGGEDEIAALDQSIRTMNEDLLKAQQERQELISMLTHDLRAPLATITGFLELVHEGMVAKLNDRGEKLALVADRNAAFMMRLIADLLDIEKARAGMLKIKKEKFAFSQLVDEMDGSLKDWAAELGVKLVLTPAAITLNGDRDMLKRVLFNLLSNAIKYSPRGSSVTLAAQQEGRLVQISVSDEGPGIAPDEQASIFDRFVQLSSGSDPDSYPDSYPGSADRQKRGGSGLGLAICKAIVELHGGRIWVQSRLGQGSTFCFTLPL